MAVEAWLSTLGCHVNRLDSQTIAALYSSPPRGFVAGWRIEVAFPSGAHKVDLLLPIGFPYQPPRVALVDAPPFLEWPHVEKDKVLCLDSNAFESDPDKPVQAVAYALGRAEDAVNDLLQGKCDEDFRDEFLSYWDWASSTGPCVISLLKPQPPSRLVRLWKGAHYYVLGETDREIRDWLANRFGKAPHDFTTVPAGILWIGEAPFPRDYPSSGTSLRMLAQHDAKANELLLTLVREQPEKIALALGVNTKNGPALGCVVVPAPMSAKYGARDPINKGFRPGTVPDGLLMARYLGGQNLMRRSVERADAAWIHGRGQDSRVEQLRGKTVVLFGCGSLGGPLAVNLAQAGVGRIILIDFDHLRWANIGRHPLGAGYVDRSKAAGLAEKLRADYPHSTFEYHSIDVDTAVRLHPEILANADLIVAATGSWAAEARLDAWHASIQRTIPILYTWMEPHAMAGHALLLAGDGHSLRDGFDGTGRPDFRVTEWPSGSPSRQEPSCGAVYQPYGPIEVGFVTNLAAELALDALIGDTQTPTYRLWIASGQRLRELGGSWSSDWQSDPQYKEAGRYIAERAWRAKLQVQAA